MSTIAPGQRRREIAVKMREPGIRSMRLRISLAAGFRVCQLVAAIEYHESRVVQVLREIRNGYQRGMTHGRRGLRYKCG